MVIKKKWQQGNMLEKKNTSCVILSDNETVVNPLLGYD
jgi:hypothetical protein